MAPSFAAEPEELVERFARAWNKGDAGGIASLFTSDADFVNVVGLWWRSREEIERAHAYDTPMGSSGYSMKRGAISSASR
jgi:uncharacterized protein (TIGR02246 family)